MHCFYFLLLSEANMNDWSRNSGLSLFILIVLKLSLRSCPDHLLLKSVPNLEPLISRWEINKFENCWNRSFRTAKILTLLYQQFLNCLISQQDMSGPSLGTLSNYRWSGVCIINWSWGWQSIFTAVFFFFLTVRWEIDATCNPLKVW